MWGTTVNGLPKACNYSAKSTESGLDRTMFGKGVSKLNARDCGREMEGDDPFQLKAKEIESRIRPPQQQQLHVSGNNAIELRLWLLPARHQRQSILQCLEEERGKQNAGDRRRKIAADDPVQLQS